ncbi:MAG: hypothetical protein KDC53_21295 [Saprospiraceae bacterium]|nr:hypothetical protein [Saprospiraceae bacterium]
MNRIQFIKIILLRLTLIGLLLILVIHALPAQIQYTRHFSRALEKCQATFVAPVEGWYKIKMLRDQFGPKYDLALQSEDREFEMHFSLDPEYRANVPHITCLTTASTLAINMDRFDIKVNVFTDEQCRAFFNADWAAYADFIPKPSLTDKQFGRLVTIFREGKGMIQEVFFFNWHDDEKDRRMYSVAFLPDNI